MAVLTHFFKADNTLRSPGATGPDELTDYTISWADLTGAGFAAGDDVVLLVGVKPWNAGANANTLFRVEFGTTFAGRVNELDGQERGEPPAPNDTGGGQYLWVDRRTLVVDENIYFSYQSTNTTPRYQEFRCFIAKLDDLTSDDFVYAEASHSVGIGTTYDTSGAGATIPATGDWWFVASTRWNINAVGAGNDMLVAIHDGTGDVAEVQIEGEDASDTRIIGTMAYRAGLEASTTVRTRFRSNTDNAHQIITSKIFGLRLEAFEDHAGVHAANTVTHSVVDTYQEVAGFGSFGLTNTGPLMVVGWPIHSSNEESKRPYGRIQIGGSDWPSADYNRVRIGENGAANQIAPLLMSYAASVTAGTLDIDLDCAEETDINPTYTCDEQVAVAFSLALAAMEPSGTAAANLQRLAAAASGDFTQVFTGSAAAAVRPLTATAAGIGETQGAGATALQELTAAATGELIFAGSAVAELQDLTAAATAAAEVQGTAAAVLQLLQAQAAGELVFAGAAAAAMRTFAALAAGQAEAQGAATAALQLLLAEASGAVGGVVVEGTAAGVMQILAAVAVGIGEAQGAAAGEIAPAAAAATGELIFAGSAVAELQPATGAAAGQLLYAGDAAAVLQGMLAEAVGAIEVSGGGSAALQSLVAEASGEEMYAGEAAAALQALIAQALGLSLVGPPIEVIVELAGEVVRIMALAGMARRSNTLTGVARTQTDLIGKLGG